MSEDEKIPQEDGQPAVVPRVLSGFGRRAFGKGGFGVSEAATSAAESTADRGAHDSSIGMPPVFGSCSGSSGRSVAK
jgi:hypothetical protein